MSRKILWIRLCMGQHNLFKASIEKPSRGPPRFGNTGALAATITIIGVLMAPGATPTFWGHWIYSRVSRSFGSPDQLVRAHKGHPRIIGVGTITLSVDAFSISYFCVCQNLT